MEDVIRGGPVFEGNPGAAVFSGNRGQRLHLASELFAVQESLAE